MQEIAAYGDIQAIQMDEMPVGTASRLNYLYSYDKLSK